MDQNNPLIPDFNLAELKLSFLKENFEFQEFYEKLENDPYPQRRLGKRSRLLRSGTASTFIIQDLARTLHDGS
jgi:hypothetical protein